MTTRRNFLKTGSISLAGLLVGEKVYSAVSTPDNKKSFSTIASKVTGDYASKRPAPEARKFIPAGTSSMWSPERSTSGR